MIHLLDQNTINQIAAGEVIERPSSVVKELVENAIDSGASAITVEIKDGGLSLIRITDNGSGIDRQEVRQAFVRHATSKIMQAEDLLTVTSLGFRGEALASIAAVAQVEMITKPKGALTGCRYEIHGGAEKAFEEIGCPEGTTIIVRNLFYNTPARKKFMKSAMTEGGYIQELMMRLAMSKPHIAMQFILNGKNKLATPGNGKLKDVIYQIYGRDMTANLLTVQANETNMQIEGFIGKPFISRGNRMFETYFINGRYMKNAVVTRAIEEAYRTFVMVHKFPFTVLQITLEPSLLDINVHPTKMEMRYQESDRLYQFIYNTLRESLLQKELIPNVTAGSAKEDRIVQTPVCQEKAVEPYETVRRQIQPSFIAEPAEEYSVKKDTPVPPPAEPEKQQLELFADKLLSEPARPKHKIIGQLFQTYWLLEYENQLFIVDQHAAHERVMYEHLMHKLQHTKIYSQQLYPPKIVTLSPVEQDTLCNYQTVFERMGFRIEPFGGQEFAIRAVPEDIFGISSDDVFTSLLADLSEESRAVSEEIFVVKLSMMACKAAVKGNMQLSIQEIHALLDELLTLENPYNCPHGRPTIIAMHKTELEKKFKRIQD